jgi:hypothetical protein
VAHGGREEARDLHVASAASPAQGRFSERVGRTLQSVNPLPAHEPLRHLEVARLKQKGHPPTHREARAKHAQNTETLRTIMCKAKVETPIKKKKKGTL